MDPIELELRPSWKSLRVDGGAPDVPALLAALGDECGALALDSAGGRPRRRSLVAFDPAVSFGGTGVGGAPLDASPASLAELEGWIRGVRLADGAELPEGAAFGGGFAGALAYDLGVHGEPLDLPRAAWPAPPVVGGLYTEWVELEHGPDGHVVRALHVQTTGTEAERARRSAHLLALLASGERAPADRSSRAMAARPERATGPAEHMDRVERTRALIARGELYQANVAHRSTARTARAARDVYASLRDVNAAPYMAYVPFRFLDGRRGTLLSASPELLLEVGSAPAGGLRARTRPIKGTVARGADAEEDAAQRERLLSSEKDLAELAMIVDLERNDLGRIARPGGVRVRGFPTLETYATVHHLVADVEADLAEGATALDALASLFPGGSITGAPKLRSMEAIAELEGEGRGFFTGSAGFLDARGYAVFNILIRTLVHRAPEPGAARAASPEDAEVSFHVGGGITYASDAALEDEETLHKAAGLLRALEGTPAG